MRVPLAVLVLTTVLSAAPQDRVAGHLLMFNDNGAWSWFEGERAVVDRLGRGLLVGSCADSSGLGGAARGGDIDLARLDLVTGRTAVFELHDRLQGDDHDSPAILVRPDGRIVAMYAKHGSDRFSRWRVTTRPGDTTQWSAERTLQLAAGVTYSNLHHLAGADGLRGVTYNVTRANNFDPNLTVSRDHGESWSYGGKLLTEGGGGDRPYLRYASDGRTRLHLLATERHPRNFDNSIYHGYVEDRTLRDSSGAVVDADVLDPQGVPPARLTPVFRTGTVFGGVVMRRAWTIDLALDDAGNPRALFQARALDRDTDHRLFFAAFDGRSWTVHEVCRLGAGLYTPENDYTGLAALHPERPGELYVSTPIDPRTQAALPHHEIFRAETTDGGRTWTFTPVTQDSTVDNLRPTVPAWSADRTALVWMRGTYTTYTDYDLAVVGTVDAPELRFDALRYVDATRTNTTLAGGGPLTATGPSASQGPTDGQWHERTGFGNGGSVFAADELGDEDVPALRTRTGGVAAGRYDVFVFFWSNPNEAWLIRAGLDAADLRTFTKQACEAVEPADTTAAIVRTGSTVQLYKCYLGRADVAAAGVLDVYVDDLATGQTSRTRTWFDGVGFAPVREEAGVTALGVACGPGDARLSVGGRPALSAQIALRLDAAVPGAVASVLAGLGGPQPVDLGIAGFRSCTLYPQVLLQVPLGPVSAGGSSAAVQVAIPSDASLLGRRATFQGLAVAPAGAQLTAAQVATVGR